MRRKRRFIMQKKILIAVLCVIVLSLSACSMLACNKDELPSEFEMPQGSRPDKASLFSAEDTSTINSALAPDATQEQLKAAVMALYDTANSSRINTPLSLVVQESDAGIDMGNVIMHAFNLRDGDKWYYQLATSVDVFGNPALSAIVSAFAGYLKVGYSTGDGNYYYFGELGPQFKCDCSIPTFPYATFVIPVDENAKPEDKPFANAMTLEEFNSTLNVLKSIHEINNMDFCKEIIADDPVITFSDGVYRVEFAVDTQNSDAELLEKWYAMPQKDMQVGGQSIKQYNSYTAVLEVWDNGYAKSFESHADRDAGMASGKPVDKYSYIWDEQRILNLAKQDQAISFSDEKSILSIDDYIEFKLEMKIVEKKLGSLEIAGIVIGCVVAVVIAIVVTIEVLVKKGKLPKLAAKREKKKQKRLEKKAAKQEKKIQLIDSEADGGEENKAEADNDKAE